MKTKDLLMATTFPDGRGKAKCVVGDTVYIENITSSAGSVKVEVFADELERILITDNKGFVWQGTFSMLKDKLNIEKY